jgi:hypothetical protein
VRRVHLTVRRQRAGLTLASIHFLIAKELHLNLECNRSSLPISTSVHLARMLDRAEGRRVAVHWLLEELGERSFGLTLLVMAVIALLPGLSTLVGLLIAWPAIQLMLGHDAASLPRAIARREIDVERLARVVAVIVPRLAWVERLIRPRRPELFAALRRLVGGAMLLVGLTFAARVPFGQVVPALVIMLLAVAYLEEDGVALLLALFAALGSLALTGAAVWGAVETIDWIDPATGT